MNGGPAERDWERIHDLFADALKRAPGDRAAFLDEACGGDAELRTEVDSLLAAHERAAAFLDRPVLGAPDPAMSDAAFEGQLVGPWRVLRLLGRGGMGTVYLAERADGEYERRVALKVVKRGKRSASPVPPDITTVSWVAPAGTLMA